MQIPLTPDDDPTIAIVRAAARASLRDLRDDLVAARSAMTSAIADVPSTTLDWFGPASQSLRDALGRMGMSLEGIHADLDQAVPLLDRIIS
ncbi:hypothetical protein [Agrococcus jejuensis]|uniref:Uncharacterized protein n=1 Tax=Agrococcus jejuensis TaxID=399736 RepID=A0A1G8D5C4_9MICO|nr:hypothetical protein [Agrococcus jejuensis]SDH52936.1 hypothetical protein SAMN04489720_1523 [Agrococcus jejuensis]